MLWQLTINNSTNDKTSGEHFTWDIPLKKKKTKEQKENKKFHLFCGSAIIKTAGGRVFAGGEDGEAAR